MRRRARGARRTSSAILGADDDSTTWRATSAVERVAALPEPARIEIVGSCSSARRERVGRRPLSRTRSVGWCPLRCIDALREVAGDLAPVRPASPRRGRVERLQRGLLSRGLLVGRSAKNQVLIFMAQPIVCAWRSVMTSGRGDLLVGAPADAALPASGASSTRRFSQDTRDVARRRSDVVLGRSRRHRRGRRPRACRRASGSDRRGRQRHAACPRTWRRCRPARSARTGGA